MQKGSSTARAAMSQFPLRLMPSVRRGAEEFSSKEGVSLNQFINLAVAEKLARLQQEEWLASRPAASAEVIAAGLEALNRKVGVSADKGDELPEGYGRELLARSSAR